MGSQYVYFYTAGSQEYGEYSSIHEGEVPLYLHIPPNITLRLVTENGTKEQQQSTKNPSLLILDSCNSTSQQRFYYSLA